MDAAIVAYPHGAAAAVVAALLERGVQGRRPERGLPPARPRRLRGRGTASTARPSCSAKAVYGLPELHRDEIARRRPRRQPRLLPDGRAPGPGAAGAGGPDRRRRRRREVRRVRARAARATADDALRLGRRERRRPTASAATATCPRSTRSCAPWAQATRSTFTPHLLPLDQGELRLLLRHADARRSDGDACASCTPRPTRASRSSSSPTRPPGVRDVRGTNVCRIHVHADRRTGKVLVFAAIDNLWKGASSQAVQNLNLMFGLDERTRARERGAVLPLALGRACTTRVSEAADRGLPRASARPAWRRGSSRRALDLGLLVCDAPDAASAARFTRSRRARRAGARHAATARSSTRCGSSWPTPATRTPPTGPGSTRPRGWRAVAGGVEPDHVASRLDGRLIPSSSTARRSSRAGKAVELPAGSARPSGRRAGRR